MSAFRRILARTGARVGLLALVAMAAMAVSALGASSASAACTGGVLKGEGSSLQKIAQQEVWGPGFEKEECGIENPEINYTSTGSGPGLEAWDFTGMGTFNTEFGYIGTDDAPSAAQIATARGAANNASVVVVPVAQAAIAVLVHPPSGCSITQITNAQLEEAFSGKITNWSEFTTGSGCSGTLTRVVRKEGSGTTYQFKNYLSKINSGAPCTGAKKWTETEENGAGGKPNIEWPECGTMAPETAAGGGALAEKVKNTEGTIGYAALPDAKAKGASFVKVQNGEVKGVKSFASPEAAEETSNCTGTQYTLPSGAETEGLNKDWSTVFGGNPTIGGSNYPICTLTYDLGWHSYATAGFTQAHIGTFVHHFFTWIIKTWLGMNIGHYYSALPTETGRDVQKAAEAASAQVE